MAPFRRALLPRSGRIKADDVTGNKALTIVKGSTGTYRIFNTGPAEIIVKATDQTDVPLEPRCSLDITVDGSIVISQTDKEEVKGIYEYIAFDSPSVIRNGKFRRDGAPAFIIAQAVGNAAFYRILNTSKRKSFTVTVGNDEITTLAPRLSVDVVAADKITIEGEDAGTITGIYDYLDPQNEIQPGRFNVELDRTDASTYQSHMIINLSGSTRKATYRIHNTGANAFAIMRGSVEIARRLLEDQSIDFEVKGAERIVAIHPSENGSNIALQGVFELIGIE